MSRRLTAAVAVIAFALAGLAGTHTASAATPKTVKISGRAYVFNHMDTYISGATIKVREYPKLSTTTDELGDYELTVPDDRNITPYILSGEGLLTRHTSPTDDTPSGQVQTHWNEVDLQTFHTRGEDIVNANFQTPQDAEYAGLKAILSVPDREDGRPEKCAIVTTASARNTRGVDYPTFWANTFGGHGVPGATAIGYPALPAPVYFNEHVIPDKTKTETSDDGGIVWPVVPTGTYRIVTSAPGARFASFLATCAPGRVINANPPWGAYELSPGEKPLSASNVAAYVSGVTSTASRTKRVVLPSIRTVENVKATITVSQGGKVIGRNDLPRFKVNKVARVPIVRRAKKGMATVKVKMTDLAGVSYTTTKKVRIPKLKSKPKRR